MKQMALMALSFEIAFPVKGVRPYRILGDPPDSALRVCFTGGWRHGFLFESGSGREPLLSRPFLRGRRISLGVISNNFLWPIAFFILDYEPSRAI